jgi:hypothetical protein
VDQETNNVNGKILAGGTHTYEHTKHVIQNGGQELNDRAQLNSMGCLEGIKGAYMHLGEHSKWMDDSYNS